MNIYPNRRNILPTHTQSFSVFWIKRAMCYLYNTCTQILLRCREKWHLQTTFFLFTQKFKKLTISMSLSHLLVNNSEWNFNTFLRLWGMTAGRVRQLQDRFCYYCFGCIVDFIVLLFYLICVDRSGSLSGSAFNQLKFVTLNIVLAILYSLKSVSQRSLLQCLNSSISSTKSSNIYSRHPHCNIK